MIQPKTNTPGDLFSTSNTRAGSGFAAVQPGTGNDRPGSSNGFQSKLTEASGLDGSRNRPGSSGGWDPKVLLSQASRADAMTKPARKDGPLQTELKRAMEGNGTRGKLGSSQKLRDSAAQDSHAEGRGLKAEASRAEAKASTTAAARNDADRPTQVGDVDSDVKREAESAPYRHDGQRDASQSTPRSDQQPDQRQRAEDGVSDFDGQDVYAAQVDPLAGAQATNNRKFSSSNPETKVDSSAASGGASAAAEAGSDSAPDSTSDAASSGASVAASGNQSGKPATEPSSGKTPPPTTINRLNSQLLTADPRRMLLGLDSLGSRLVMSAAQVMAGDATGWSVPNPTAAARVEASAANQPGLAKFPGASPLSDNGGTAGSAAVNNQGLTGFAGDAAAGATNQTDGAHNADPVSSPGHLLPTNENDAPAPGTQDAALESVRAAMRNNSADMNASAHAKLDASVAGIKEAAKQAGDQAASARAGSGSDPASRNGRADEAQAISANASSGNGGQAGQPGGQFGSSSGGDLSGKAAGNGGQPMPGEQQQASRVLAQQVERAVASASRQAERLGGASGPITLRLKPESLGQVRIKLTAGESGGGLGVKIEVGSTDAQRLLSESLGSLRDALKAKSLVLEQSAVGVDPSLAPNTAREPGQSRESAKPAEAERPTESRAGAREQHGLHGRPHGGDGLGRSASDGSTSDHGRGRQDPRSARGGFFDGAVLVPGGQRVNRTAG